MSASSKKAPLSTAVLTEGLSITALLSKFPSVTFNLHRGHCHKCWLVLHCWWGTIWPGVTSDPHYRCELWPREPQCQWDGSMAARCLCCQERRWIRSSQGWDHTDPRPLQSGQAAWRRRTAGIWQHCDQLPHRWPRLRRLPLSLCRIQEGIQSIPQLQIWDPGSRRYHCFLPRTGL